jgi:peroxiredoxin
MTETTKPVLQIGDPMPDLTLPEINGGEIQLSHYAGKKYIIYMWASW